MEIRVETGSKPFAGGGFLAFRKANRLLGGCVSNLIDEKCPNIGVPNSKRIELLVGQVIHGRESTREAWRNAKQTNAAAFVDRRLFKQNARGLQRAIEGIGNAGSEALYEEIARTALEKMGVSLAVVHEDSASQYFTGKKAPRAKKVIHATTGRTNHKSTSVSCT